MAQLTTLGLSGGSSLFGGPVLERPLVAASAMAFGGPLDDSTSIGSPDVATWPEVRYKKQNAQSSAVTHLISLFFKKNLGGIENIFFWKEGFLSYRAQRLQCCLVSDTCRLEHEI